MKSCQDLSLAGKGVGLSGERSGLWFEYLRIIKEARPRGVLIENVPGLLRRGLDVVVGGLVDAGYAVEATRLKASDVGAIHRRERVFVIAYAKCEQLRIGQGRSSGKSGQGTPLTPIDGVERFAPGTSKRMSQPLVDRAGDGIPHRMDRLKALGNAVVPSCAYVAARRLLERIS